MPWRALSRPPSVHMLLDRGGRPLISTSGDKTEAVRLSDADEYPGAITNRGHMEQVPPELARPQGSFADPTITRCLERRCTSSLATPSSGTWTHAPMG